MTDWYTMVAFAHPFRFINGSAVKVDDTSEQYAALVVASVVRTNRGELPITVDFGTYAPEFSSLDVSGIMYSISSYYPEISINGVSQTRNDQNGQVEIKVEFTRQAG